MNTKNLSRKIWFTLSIICFLLGIAVWIPNIFFGRTSNLLLFTFIINPIGFVFGYISKSKFGMVSNAFMTISIFIFMFVGYLIVAFIGGKP
jgi:hypothetical protein